VQKHRPFDIMTQMKLTKQDLENCSTTELAVMCGKVANDPTHYTEAGAAEACSLKLEWMSLQTPPEPSLKGQQRKEAQLESLHTRMAEFLAGLL
jgi:hypothetical protein